MNKAIPDDPGIRMTLPPLPSGFRIAFDPDTKQLDGTTLFGGSPARVMRLSRTGVTALTELREGPVRTRAAGILARRLTDAGLAHPQPPSSGDSLDVTVIIPVRDRVGLLDQCLTALGRRYPVIVVDDGSLDPRAVADVVATHDATLIRRQVNGGPGAARNTGLAAAGDGTDPSTIAATAIIAFIDSDCAPRPGWIEELACHLADPLVAAVAPRIVAAPTATNTWAGRYTAACGSLDLGDRQGRVIPGTRLAYVPTAALLVRRAALLDLVQDGTGSSDVFDETLRVGEDVDLIWRLHEAGWRIRYDPAVQVRHQEPDSWPAVLTRRFRYGTSAAPLAVRHPDAMAPLVLHPWPALTVAGLLARQPLIAGAGFLTSVLVMRRTLRRARVPTDGLAPAMLGATRQTWLGIGRYAIQFAAPVLAGLLLTPGGRSRTKRWGRRAGVVSLLLGPPLTTWRQRRPDLDPARFVLGHIADDLAYGAGVWTGSVREHTTVPIRPVIAWRPLRIDPSKPANPIAAQRTSSVTP
jgi:mycofactocin system glycosyltransferase